MRNVQTIRGDSISTEMLLNYFHNLINAFFKILPLREQEEETLETYMCSMQAELIGCKRLIVAIDNDPLYLSLLSILQYLIDNCRDISVTLVKREVFNAISICNKLKARYATVGGE